MIKMTTLLHSVFICIALHFIGKRVPSSPSVRRMTTGRVDGAFVFHARLKEMSANGRGPQGPMPARAAGLFERDTVALEHKGPKKEHGWFLVGTVNSLKSLQIHVPKAVLTGHDAELMCSYELEGAQLYSIRWYRNMIEFYRFVPKESPATKVFPVAEIKVDVAASDQNRVVLTEVDRTLTGEYQCEVSADAPLFHTDIKAAMMVVVEPPLTSPNVTSDRISYIGGDHIRVNCSSPPSLPAANVTWYVNEQMVPGFTANHVLNFSNGYASSLATLELEAAVHSPVPTLMIRCEASIFDVWRSTSHTLVLRERSANPASALGRSLTGAATETCLPTIMVLLLQFFLQLLLQRYSGTSIR